MSTYHISLHDALWSFPRAAALVLLTAFADRNGHNQLSYVDIASGRARADAKAWLNANFTITDEPLTTIGWQLGTKPHFFA